MSIKTTPTGKVIVRSVLTLYPERDGALIDILQEAERKGASLAAVIVELMRTGLPNGSSFEAATDEEELVDLSQMAQFFDIDPENEG